MVGSTKLDKVFSPLNIGGVQIKNRIIRSGAGTHTATTDHFVSDRTIGHYEALARGGVGMVTVEGTQIDYLRGDAKSGEMKFDDDKYIPRVRELVERVHQYGCGAFIQFAHPGASHPLPGIPTVAASAMTKEEMPPQERPFPPVEPPRALELSEIETLIDLFAEYSERAKKAGFDGVEINGAHSHLINSFISRVWNKRRDKYGNQSLENRSRFMVEIVQAIKTRAGQDFPVITVINGMEHGIKNGTTLEEAQGIAKILEAAGADAIHVRAFGYGDGMVKEWLEQVFYPEPPNPLPEVLDWSRRGSGAAVPLAAAFRKVVSIPVLVTGRLDPVLGDRFIREGKVDFIQMQRRLIADPELPNKVAAGRMEDIAPCTACLTCCSEVALERDLRCRINAAIGSAVDFRIPPAEKKKKVLVVGGGPAGMEAARVAALRGHQVTLYEKSSKLGGLLHLATIVKGTEIEDLPALIDYLKTQITKLGVDIKLGREFTPAMIEQSNPDVVIVATGGTAAIPPVPGLNRQNVVSGPALHQKLKSLLKYFDPQKLRSMTKMWMPLGKDVIIIGGAMQGLELAEFLLKRGRRVTVVDTGTAESLGEGLAMAMRMSLLVWLGDKGVPMITEVKIEEVVDDGLVIVHKDGQRQLLEADTIVTALPLETSPSLFQALNGKVAEVYAIGDCSKPGPMIDAIASGYHTAMAV